MADHSYESFSATDSYTHYQTASSQSYAYLDSTYGAPMNSMDSFPPMNASYDFSIDHASGAKYPHSPATTDAEQFMPRLTASSESGQSTSSSAMGSPQLAAQFVQHEPWNPLISGQSLGMAHDMSSDIFTREPFYTSSMEQESIMATKIPGFIGESSNNLLSSHFNQAASLPIGSTIAGQLYHPGNSCPYFVDRSRQLPAPMPLRSPAVPILLSQHSQNRLDGGFKSPGLPASATQPLHRPMVYPDPRQQRQGRRNSLLSNQIYPPVTSSPEQASALAYASPVSYTSPFRIQSSQSPSPSAGTVSCRFPSSYLSSRCVDPTS